MRHAIMNSGEVVGIASGDVGSAVPLPDGAGLGWRLESGEWLPPLPFVPSPPTRAEIEASRLRAYADPLTGSDRYFAEAMRENLLGNVEAADAARALGMARFAEIQAEYPWPAE